MYICVSMDGGGGGGAGGGGMKGMGTCIMYSH